MKLLDKTKFSLLKIDLSKKYGKGFHSDIKSGQKYLVKIKDIEIIGEFTKNHLGFGLVFGCDLDYGGISLNNPNIQEVYKIIDKRKDNECRRNS